MMDNVTRSPNRDLRIAILIPVFNEEPVIQGTIDALLRAHIPLSDIYIIDDRSIDRTVEIARQMGVNVYSAPENGGKAKAQQVALKHFQLLERYQWLIFLDGDTKVDENFFNVMYASAEKDPSIGLCLGQVCSVPNNHIYSASRAFDYTYGQDIAKIGQDNFNVVFVAPGCASMYRTDLLSKLKIDHMTLAEDMDLTMQVHRARERVSYVPGAIVNTQDPGTFKDYHKQVLRWYRGFWQVIKKHEVFAFKKKQRIDLYMILLVTDGLLLNRLFWLALMLILYPTAVPYVLGIDLSISSAIALYSAYRTKRWDVIYKFPIYYWLSYLNFYAYVRSFIEIVVLRKELLAWNKVKRYDFDNPISQSKEI